MIEEVGKGLLAVFAGITFIAITSVVVGKNSKAPQAIAAAGSALANVVGAAVNPVHTANTNGHNGNNTFSTSSFNTGLGILQSFGNSDVQPQTVQ